MLTTKKCYADFSFKLEDILFGILFALNFSLNFLILLFLIFNPSRKPSNFFLVVSLISIYVGYKSIFQVIEEIPDHMASYKYIFPEIFVWLLGFCSLYVWTTRRFSFESSLQKSLNIRFFILSLVQMLAFDVFPASNQRYFETFLFVCIIIPMQNLLGAIYRNVIVTSILFIISSSMVVLFSPFYSKKIPFNMQSFLPILFILVIKYIIDIVLDLKYNIQKE